MGLELRVVISANINSTIAVILSPKSSLYDLQKPRYDILILRATKSPISRCSPNFGEVGIPNRCKVAPNTPESKEKSSCSGGWSRDPGRLPDYVWLCYDSDMLNSM